MATGSHSHSEEGSHGTGLYRVRSSCWVPKHDQFLSSDMEMLVFPASYTVLSAKGLPPTKEKKKKERKKKKKRNSVLIKELLGSAPRAHTI